MFQQCLMTLTGVPVATSSCTKTVYLMIKATRTHALYLKPQPISSLDAMYMSWCGKPQPGGGMHPPKPRG